MTNRERAKQAYLEASIISDPAEGEEVILAALDSLRDEVLEEAAVRLEDEGNSMCDVMAVKIRALRGKGEK